MMKGAKGQQDSGGALVSACCKSTDQMRQLQGLYLEKQSCMQEEKKGVMGELSSIFFKCNAG